jgi:hypothetical protein
LWGGSAGAVAVKLAGSDTDGLLSPPAGPALTALRWPNCAGRAAAAARGPAAMQHAAWDLKQRRAVRHRLRAHRLWPLLQLACFAPQLTSDQAGSGSRPLLARHLPASALHCRAGSTASWAAAPHPNLPAWSCWHEQDNWVAAYCACITRGGTVCVYALGLCCCGPCRSAAVPRRQVAGPVRWLQVVGRSEHKAACPQGRGCRGET